MFRIWCECDIGQESIIFSTREKAENWLVMYWDVDTGFNTWQEAWAEGLVGFEEVTLDPE